MLVAYASASIFQSHGDDLATLSRETAENK